MPGIKSSPRSVEFSRVQGRNYPFASKQTDYWVCENDGNFLTPTAFLNPVKVRFYQGNWALQAFFQANIRHNLTDRINDHVGLIQLNKVTAVRYYLVCGVRKTLRKILL